jgi:hypothetical protein
MDYGHGRPSVSLTRPASVIGMSRAAISLRAGSAIDRATRRNDRCRHCDDRADKSHGYHLAHRGIEHRLCGSGRVTVGGHQVDEGAPTQDEGPDRHDPNREHGHEHRGQGDPVRQDLPPTPRPRKPTIGSPDSWASRRCAISPPGECAWLPTGSAAPTRLSPRPPTMPATSQRPRSAGRSRRQLVSLPVRGVTATSPARMSGSPSGAAGPEPTFSLPG